MAPRDRMTSVYTSSVEPDTADGQSDRDNLAYNGELYTCPSAQSDSCGRQLTRSPKSSEAPRTTEGTLNLLVRRR